MTTTILVVDDDPVALRLLDEAVKNGGFESLRAYGAEDALRKIKAHRPALVLTDLEMPKCNGVELISLIREDEEICNTPIIAVTSFAWDAIGQAATRLGCDSTVAKPFTRQQLLAKVTEVLATGHVEPQKSPLRALVRSESAPQPVGNAAVRDADTEMPIFDRDTFLEYLDGDLANALETTELLLATMPGRLQAIRDAVIAGDADGVRAVAHSLKGSVAFFAATAVVCAAYRLEKMGEAGNLTEAPQRYFELERAVASLVMALEGFVRDTRRGPVASPKKDNAPTRPLRLVSSI